MLTMQEVPTTIVLADDDVKTGVQYLLDWVKNVMDGGVDWGPEGFVFKAKIGDDEVEGDFVSMQVDTKTSQIHAFVVATYQDAPAYIHVMAGSNGTGTEDRIAVSDSSEEPSIKELMVAFGC